MTKKKFFSVFLVVCCIMAVCAGCGQQDQGNKTNRENKEPELTTFTSTDGLFQISATEEWQEMTGELHEEATLELGSESKNKYLVIIPESKIDLDMTIAEYTDIVRNITSANLENVEMQDPVAVTINGMDAYCTELLGKVDSLNVAYWIYTVDCPEHLVQVIAWTLKSKQEPYRENIEQIVHTFQPVQQGR